jgi:hypothetical protein
MQVQKERHSVQGALAHAASHLFDAPVVAIFTALEEMRVRDNPTT